MFSMAWHSAGAFLKGQLFRNNASAFALLAVGVGVTTIILIATYKFGLPLYAAAGLAGVAGGLLQPRLYKNLKYR